MKRSTAVNRAHLLDTTTIAESPRSLSLRGRSGERAGERGAFHRIGAANWNPLSRTLSPLPCRGERESTSGMVVVLRCARLNHGWTRIPKGLSEPNSFLNQTPHPSLSPSDGERVAFRPGEGNVCVRSAWGQCRLLSPRGTSGVRGFVVVRGKYFRLAYGGSVKLFGLFFGCANCFTQELET